MEESFEAVYRRELPRLVRLAHLITGSNGVAEEVVHDVFAAAYRRWRRIEDPSGYLYRAVVNRSRSLLRRRKLEWRHRIHRLEVVHPPEVDELWGAIQRLPARRRTAIVLRYYADMSIAQIADVMGARPGTVRSLIHRGHHSLRQEIDDA
jgi:RNA polymerase sigma-70 factor (sigma-E family)